MSVIVHIPHMTERLGYTLDFIFSLRGISYHTEPSERKESKEVQTITFVAGETSMSLGISPLLFETGINEKMRVEAVSDEVDSFFSFDGQPDLVGSVFYVLTRYEEYLAKSGDEHGRFQYSDSVLSEKGRIAYCLCDRWAEKIAVGLGFLPDRTVKMVPSFDIDNTYAYRLKRGRRMWFSVLRDLIQGNRQRIRERREVRKGAKDPYDTFADIREIAGRFPETRVFWLVAPTGPRDRNISVSVKEHQELIRRMDEGGHVGLHPGYSTWTSPGNLLHQKQQLEQVLGHSIDRTRQHFLRFRLPDTFRALENTGVRHEYSLGFAEHPGFRCGTARPHLWFDLEENRVSALTIHPFSYMDGSLNEYLCRSVEESKSLISALYEEVSTYGGEFIFIWHNETIGDYGKWHGWREVLEFTLNLNHE